LTDTPEIQNTPDPGLVTVQLANLLGALGEFVPGGVLVKNTREEVYSHGARTPWRRSSFWTAIRVSIQRMLMLAYPEDHHHAHYKAFMIFFFCTITKRAVIMNSPYEVLDLLRKKLARRIAKREYHLTSFPFLMAEACSVTTAAHSCVSAAWEAFRATEKLASEIPFLDVSITLADLTLPLENSRDYLRESMAYQLKSSAQSSKFEPLYRLKYDLDGLPDLSESNCELTSILGEFESWVASSLPDFLKIHEASAKLCTRMAQLIDNYITNAKKLYQGAPVLFSTMLLTTLELWVVLDSIQVSLTPMLKDYCPGLDHKLLWPLLARKREHLQRILKVEAYLRDRKSSNDNSYPNGIFSPISHASFSVRYYDEALGLHKRRNDIETGAQVSRDAAKYDWEEIREEWECRQVQFNSMSCDVDKETGAHSAKTCSKCKLARVRLRVLVHEWPLPPDEVLLKNVIFELEPPPGYLSWRDATWQIVHDLGRRKHKSGRPSKMKLPEYQYLCAHEHKPSSRLFFVSDTDLTQKGKTMRIFPIGLEKICVNNTANWRLRDTRNEIWVDDQNEIPSFNRFCSLKLPSTGLYNEQLQWAVDTTFHSSNQVVSRQDDCPVGLRVEEFLSFGELRSGHRLQSLNILRESTSSRCNLKDVGVGILFKQALWEAGPSNDETSQSVYRESHEEFKDPSFCEQLICALEDISADNLITSKQDHVLGLDLIIEITLRLVSLTTDPGVQSRGFKLLRCIRQTTLEWTRHFSQQDGNAYSIWVFRAANLVRSTFDVDSEDSTTMLHDNVDIEALVESMIYTYQNRPSDATYLEIVMSGQHVNGQYETLLRRLLPRNPAGLNTAVLLRLGTSDLDGSWDFPEEYGKVWCRNTSQSREILFNILTGQFLVAGKAIGRLPHEYSSDSYVERLFQQVSLNDFFGCPHL
jgi:hypothetical protein